ncbi:OLC1v1027522C1 [Oldenlandia corymbosa var. corymbosa]|uniref:OLC1v1027522C1 n=1 Tax=Oldenlandia corymbosa var. corymbosa TaxID=529605 RepID=A0AAV1CBY1_OLDCO|nr:OLC1v1027522C1 [Oldenlandia corymbosa var. corymbosa]
MSQAYNDDAKVATHDSESGRGIGGSDDMELRRKKRKQLLVYIAAFAVFQTAIILFFVLVIMKVRTPTFGFDVALLMPSNSQFGTRQNPSFDLKMNAVLRIENPNFGSYEFENSSVVFYYEDEPVGEVAVEKTGVGWRSTKRVDASLSLSSKGLPNNTKSQLGNDLTSGVLTLNTKSKLDGKVDLVFIFNKKKAIDMDCALTIGVADKVVRQISCK